MKTKDKSVVTTLSNEKVESEMMDSAEIRKYYSNRVDVLDNVQDIIYLPNSEVATMKSVAEFYKVDVKVIEKLVQRNNIEFKQNGLQTYSKKEVIDLLKMEYHNRVKDSDSKVCTIQTNCLISKPIEFVVNTSQYNFSIETKNGEEIILPNRGLKLFNKRCILLVGMLLRDSEVAKALRFKILDSQEMLSEEQNDKLLRDIQKEKELAQNIVDSKSEQALSLALEQMKVFQDTILLQNQQMTSMVEVIQKLNLKVEQLEKMVQSGNVVQAIEEEIDNYLNCELNRSKRKWLNRYVREVAKITNIKDWEAYVFLRETVKTKSEERHSKDKSFKIIDITDRLEKHEKNYNVKTMYDVLTPQEFDFTYDIAQSTVRKLRKRKQK